MRAATRGRSPSDGGATRSSCVRALEGEHALELRVRGAAPAALFQLSSAARRTFDLAADPARIALAFAGGPAARRRSSARRPGLRIPGAWDPFECAVRAVLGQQVSVAAGAHAGRAPRRPRRPRGRRRRGRPHPSLPFARAALAAADLDGLGLTGARVARAAGAGRARSRDGALDFGAPADEVAAGAGGAARVRGLDRAVRRAARARRAGRVPGRRTSSCGAWPPRTARRSPTRALEARAEAWRPWRGYAVLHLWRAAGDVPALAPRAPRAPRRRLRS